MVVSEALQALHKMRCNANGINLLIIQFAIL
jgi:hypothetical protein